ncbi:hypothetical protein BAUCODRAFT_132031, partial [Baudoinia panamericana UAMH 10762]
MVGYAVVMRRLRWWTRGARWRLVDAVKSAPVHRTRLLCRTFSGALRQQIVSAGDVVRVDSDTRATARSLQTDQRSEATRSGIGMQYDAGAPCHPVRSVKCPH